MREIVYVLAREILDSRGIPTVEVDIELADGSFARASSPSGFSIATLEAVELRDEDNERYKGKGVLKAVEAINNEIAEIILGIEATEQTQIDKMMIELDGTEHKSKFGTNAILPVSLAVAKAAAKSLHLPLFKYIGGIDTKTLPMPLINVINGGKHADNNLDFQEFMIIPIGAKNMADAIRMSAEVYYCLKDLLKHKGYSTNIGDEGGFAPTLDNNEHALDILVEAIHNAGYKIYSDFVLAIDAGASEFYKDNIYQLKASNLELSSEDMVIMYRRLIENYPIISIEDPLSEHDKAGWKLITKELGEKVQLVGDDLFATNYNIFKQAIKDKIANSIVIKPNQVGSLTEAMSVINLALNNGYRAIVSNRSGETEDTTIVHLAIATNCGQIKLGGLSRTDRLAKYNELLRVAELLGDDASLDYHLKKYTDEHIK